MDTQTLSFVLGAVLLLIGILGGGFEIRELKVPRVNRGPRLLAAMVGSLFIVLGLSGTLADPPSRGAGNVPGPAPTPVAIVTDTPAAADFTIHNELGDGEISEQVTVLIDGKTVGDISVDTHHPAARLLVTVPKPGTYSYTVEANALVQVDGNPHQYVGVGQGMVRVERGKQFELRGTISGETWVVVLAERS